MKNGAGFSPQLAAIFSTLVEEASGIHYGPDDRELFGAKIAAQAAEAGYDTLLDYYYRLRYDDPSGVETRALIQGLVVHETYFFRELAPLVHLVDGPLTEAVNTHGRARVWSAACATGEEPLTMAMLLDSRGLLDRVEIIGTDISESAIVRARSGRHSRRALRPGHEIPDLVRKYLVLDDSGVSVAPALRERVQFRTLNLLDEPGIDRLGVFDVILCRNVLIYFRDEMIHRVLDRLTRSLSPGGLLAVGVSESLLRFGTALRCEERSGAFFYRSAP